MTDNVQHPVAAEIMGRFAQRTVRSKDYDTRAKERPARRRHPCGDLLRTLSGLHGVRQRLLSL